jgi:Mn-containing catalase
MFFHVQKLINEIVPDQPDPLAANALQEGLGGQFGEMRTMMQYLFQSFNFRGPATQYKDLIQAVATEEISHVELIATTIARLLDGAPGYQPNGDGGVPGAGGSTPLNPILGKGNIHHFLVGAQGALPVDAAGNPWSGSYVYNSGNLVLDLLYNLMLESTGRLQKCRIYEMSSNKTLRATVAYLIVRDEVHEKVYAKALESLGVDWGKTLPIPNFDASKYPEVKALYDKGIGNVQYTFRLDGSQAGAIFNGKSPFNDGATVATSDEAPQGVAIPQAPERLEEFAPGLTPELMELMQAAARLATTGATVSGSGVTVGGALGTTATPAQEATTVTERVRVQDQTGRVHDVTNRTDGQ